MNVFRRDRWTGSLARRVVARRDLIQGGLGLLTGAALGGLPVTDERFSAPAPPPREPVAPSPPPEPAALQRGASGDTVRALQEQLNATGYWCGTPDGGFGHLTQQAVWALQKAHGLTRDAVVGPMTTQALASGYRPAPAAGGDHLEIHLASQLILIVRGGATTMVLNTSTGNGEPYEYQGREYVAHTPPGDFAVWYTDASGWREGELGELYRPMFYSGDYAVHGSESIPPWPASHGCARISVAAMDLVWAQGLLAKGGRVLVV